MSYDIYLTDPVSGKTLETDVPHQIRGGTYAEGGTKELWLNITYNYSQHFQWAFGEMDGIEILEGLSGADAIPLLQEAIDKLADDVSDNYWEATQGNAKVALNGLLALCKMRPDGVVKVM